MSVSCAGWSIVSLGLSCQTSHQLRQRLAGTAPAGRQFHEDAHYFDYIVTPLATLQKILDGDFPQLNSKSEIGIVVDQPFWMAQEIFFPHNFRQWETAGSIDIKATYERSASKIAYLRRKFLALDHADTGLVFVISNAQYNICHFSRSPDTCHTTFWFSRDKIEAVSRSLRRRYGPRFCRLVVVESKSSFSGAWRLPDVTRYNSGTLAGPAGAQWKGDDAFWQAMLSNELRQEGVTP